MWAAEWTFASTFCVSGWCGWWLSGLSGVEEGGNGGGRVLGGVWVGESAGLAWGVKMGVWLC